MSTDGFAVAVTRDETRWQLTELDDEVVDDLSAALSAVRQAASHGGATFAMVAVDDEFFAIVRPTPGGAALLVSDATAALDYDIAADILDLLHIPIPDEDDVDDGPWPEGDIGILADFGISVEAMQVIVDDEDLYPDEQLLMIAERCGFADQLSALIDSD